METDKTIVETVKILEVINEGIVKTLSFYREVVGIDQQININHAMLDDILFPECGTFSIFSSMRPIVDEIRSDTSKSNEVKHELIEKVHSFVSLYLDSNYNTELAKKLCTVHISKESFVLYATQSAFRGNHIDGELSSQLELERKSLLEKLHTGEKYTEFMEIYNYYWDAINNSIGKLDIDRLNYDHDDLDLRMQWHIIGTERFNLEEDVFEDKKRGRPIEFYIKDFLRWLFKARTFLGAILSEEVHPQLTATDIITTDCMYGNSAITLLNIALETYSKFRSKIMTLMPGHAKHYVYNSLSDAFNEFVITLYKKVRKIPVFMLLAEDHSLHGESFFDPDRLRNFRKFINLFKPRAIKIGVGTANLEISLESYLDEKTENKVAHSIDADEHDEDCLNLEYGLSELLDLYGPCNEIYVIQKYKDIATNIFMSCVEISFLLSYEYHLEGIPQGIIMKKDNHG